MDNRRASITALVLASAIAWSCEIAPTRASEEVGAGDSSTSATGSVDLQNLESLDQLIEAFNQDEGHPRLVLLLSPT